MNINFQTLEHFLADYIRLNGTFPASPFATTTYDTVWTIAMTVRTALISGDISTLRNVHEENRTQLNALMNLISWTQFHGLSVSIVLL